MPDFNTSGWSPPDINLSRRAIALIAIGGVVVVTLFTMVFQIPADSIGVVMRFGEPVREVGPGLHVKAPVGVEEVRIVPTQRQRKVEFGYRTQAAAVDSSYKREGYEHESLMLTGDLNMIDVEWVVQYRIDDPIKFLYEMREPTRTLRDISESVMRRIVGNMLGSEVLTVGRVEIQQKAREEIQQALESNPMLETSEDDDQTDAASENDEREANATESAAVVSPAAPTISDSDTVTGSSMSAPSRASERTSSIISAIRSWASVTASSMSVSPFSLAIWT